MNEANGPYGECGNMTSCDGEDAKKFPISKVILSCILASSVRKCRLLISDIFYGNKPRLRNVNLVLIFFVCALIGSCSGARKKVRLTVIAPEKASQDEETLGAILPAVDLAIKAVRNPIYGRLPGYDIEHRYRNSNCSPTYGPLAAIELHNISGKL